MNTSQFLDTFLSPFRYTAMLLAAIVFWVLGALGLLIAATLQNVIPFLGSMVLVFFFAVMVPALTGYLVQVVEWTSRRQAPPVADAELFLLLGRDWRLFPLVPAAALYVIHGVMSAWSPMAAAAVTFLLAILVLPLSLMLFSVTESRVESIKPWAMLRLLKRLWPDYGWTIPALLVFSIVGGLAWQVALPPALILAVGIYLLMVFALLCGRLLTVVDVADETDIAAPREATADELDAAVTADRSKVLNHAYGLLSRGNRDGGFAHLDAYLDNCEDDAAAALWFYFQMQAWDLGDVPLFYAQGLIARLLDRGDDAAALKVLTSCLHRNENFRPRPEDRQRLSGAAEQAGNGEISRALSRMP